MLLLLYHLVAMEANFANDQGSVQNANFNIMELITKNYHKILSFSEKIKSQIKVLLSACFWDIPQSNI